LRPTARSSNSRLTGWFPFIAKFRVGRNLTYSGWFRHRYLRRALRPDIVWFGEMLDPEIINAAFSKAEEAELFFVVGTSALVHPAATLPIVAQQHGAILVEINVERTALSDIVDFHFQGKSGQFFPKLVELLKEQIST